MVKRALGSKIIGPNGVAKSATLERSLECDQKNTQDKLEANQNLEVTNRIESQVRVK